MKKFLNDRPWILYYGSVLFVVLIATSILALRYIPAFGSPNFYAEDGRVFVNTVLEHGYLKALITGFNGYLVLGQYLLTDIAVGIHTLLKLPFYDLPFIIACVSCLFMGLTVSLPYILFRRELGTMLSLLAVLFGAFVPLHTFDYAVIGTLGNLKFAFLYWAVLLILYRHLHRREKHKVFVVDGLLLLCILTNAPLLLLLPFILFSYKNQLAEAYRRKSLTGLKITPFISFLILGVLSFIYVCAIYFKGIPELQGYLDTPYDMHATLKILYRVTLYTWLFPASDTLRGSLVLILLCIFVWSMGRYKASRFTLLLGLWAIFVTTVSFVANRPGISSYYGSFSIDTTDQFFYAQSLVFIFVTVWGIAIATKRLQVYRAAFLIASALFLMWSIPLGSSYGSHADAYSNLGTVKQNISTVCQASRSENVTIQNYPDGNWQWTLPKAKAC